MKKMELKITQGKILMSKKITEMLEGGLWVEYGVPGFQNKEGAQGRL